MKSSTDLEPRRRPDHPSQRALEQLAYAPATECDAEVDEHAQKCPDCLEQVQRLRAAAAVFVQQRPARPFVAELQQRARHRQEGLPRAGWRGFRPVPVALATLLLAGLGALLWWPVVEDLPDAVQLKGAGAVSLQLFVSRDGAAASAHDAGAPLFPADVVRFGVTAAEPGYLLIANVDEKGRFYRYYPEKTARSAAVAAGFQLLAGSIELDEFLGEERLIVVFSRRPLDEATVRTATRAAFEVADKHLARMRPPDLPAQVQLVPIHKRVRQR